MAKFSTISLQLTKLFVTLSLAIALSVIYSEIRQNSANSVHLCVPAGGYTLVLKSEGAVREHQADVLGVYRMVDNYNERPVYKQDGGENYIYYRSAKHIFIVLADPYLFATRIRNRKKI